LLGGNIVIVDAVPEINAVFRGAGDAAVAMRVCGSPTRLNIVLARA